LALTWAEGKQTNKLARPVNSSFPISSPFGVTRKLSVYKNQEKTHNGIDFAVPVGTPVYSVCGGRIFAAGWQAEHDQKAGFGLRIWQVAEIDGVVYHIFYAHLSKLLCKAGDVLESDFQKIIGESGNTGSSTGPHLHVGMRDAKTMEWHNMEFV